MKVLCVQAERIVSGNAYDYVEQLKHDVEGYTFDMMVLPEKWISSEFQRDSELLSELLSQFRDISERHSSVVIPGSYSIWRDDSLYNSAPVIDNGKILGFQDKISLFLKENGRYTRGKEINTFRAGGVTIAVPVCYDLDFPYYAKLSVDRGAEMLINPSLIASDFREMWYIYVRGRSLENRLPVVSVNSSSSPFNGGSVVTGMHPRNGGIILENSSMGRESMKLFETDVEGLREFVRSRRAEDPGMYGLSDL